VKSGISGVGTDLPYFLLLRCKTGVGV
jgi:hypothetical protein